MPILLARLSDIFSDAFSDSKLKPEKLTLTNSAKEPPFVVIISIQMTTQGQVCIPLCSICSIWRDIRRQIRRMICRSIPWLSKKHRVSRVDFPTWDRCKNTLWDPRNNHLLTEQHARKIWCLGSSFTCHCKKIFAVRFMGWCCFRNCCWHHCSKSSNAKFGAAQQMFPETAPWLRRPCKRQAQAGNFKQHTATWVYWQEVHISCLSS